MTMREELLQALVLGLVIGMVVSSSGACVWQVVPKASADSSATCSPPLIPTT
jgi:hypothetical protein